ncbi:MAG TPA: sugar ABC transporter permease, partial [Clostridia bacterium]|nr:sugar ABC transporter permease [Clostridia bacterium]
MTGRTAYPFRAAGARSRRARNWQLYALLIPVAAYFIVFKYMPMLGLQIAFKNYSIRRGILASPWIGLDHFARFFKSYKSGPVIRNTVMISLLTLLLSTPAPILLALLLNELRSGWYKRLVQTVTYLPYFISTVVLCSMVILFLSYDCGIVNQLRQAMGGQKIYFMSKAAYFKLIYALSTVWQTMGWNSIIYIAALSG